MTKGREGRWLLLIHQLPPKPAYLRVKVWRRLQGLGAVAIKNTVYVMPRTDPTTEDFQWVAREIAKAGGEAAICTAGFIEGLSDAQVESLFHAARDADYRQLADEAKGRSTRPPAAPEGRAGARHRPRGGVQPPSEAPGGGDSHRFFQLPRPQHGRGCHAAAPVPPGADQGPAGPFRTGDYARHLPLLRGGPR